MPAAQKKVTTIGKYLLDRLFELGVEHIFGVPGDYVLRFNKLIEESPIKFINTNSENPAGYAADAYARLRGIGCACVTYGVGINITNAIAQAYVEGSPVVLISGTVGTNELRPNYSMHHLINKSLVTHKDTTQMEIYRQITVGQALLDDPQTAQTQIDRLLDICLLNQKPVYFELPRNCVDLEFELAEKAPSYDYPPSDPEALREAIEETIRLISKSRHPLIWAGREIASYDLNEALLEFAQNNQIPIASSMLGKTVIDEHHPLALGVYQGEMSPKEIVEFVQKCDFVLIAGVIMDDLDTGIFTEKIHPSKRILATNRKLMVNHHQYNDVRFEDYINHLRTIVLPPRHERMAIPKHGRYPLNFTPQSNTKLTTKRAFECIQGHLTKDNIVVADVGDCLFASADLTLPQDSFIASAFFASLGSGTPEAIGAQLAEPNRRVVAIVGDGGFQMTAMELSAAVRYRLNLIVIVLNNHGYGTERLLLEGSYNDIVDWNYTEIPKVLGGGKGIKAATEEELDRALKEAQSNKEAFYIIEVELGKTDFSPSLRRLGEFLGGIVKAK